MSNTKGRTRTTKPKPKSRAKREVPDFVCQNLGWRAKYEEEEDQIELVDFPLWAIWFETGPGGVTPKVECIVPSDDDGNFDFGSELEGYCGFEEPQDMDDPSGMLDDDDDDDDDDGDGLDDGDDDDDDGDDDGDDDDNPLDRVSDDDDVEVIDTDGVPVEDGEPAGRVSG